jgi:hypothetical protein
MPVNRAKELNHIRVHHFHAYNRIRLTVFTLPFENPESQCTPKEIVYGVGMALCHKGDNGNRKEGLELADMSATLAKMEAEHPDPQKEYRTWETWLMINPGMFIFRSPEALKNLILHLRAYERCYGDSRCFSEYNRVFRGNFKHVGGIQ